jgi:hypothetical protein
VLIAPGCISIRRQILNQVKERLIFLADEKPVRT